MAGGGDSTVETVETHYKDYKGPPLLGKAKSYELWKIELEFWLELTDLDKKSLGITVALSLPEDCKFGKGIKSGVLENVKKDQLKAENGQKHILTYLDEILGKDQTVDKFDRFKEFVWCKKTPEQNIDEYLREFDSKVSRLQSSGQKMDGDIITFMLLLNCNLQRLEISLVMSKIDFSKKDKVYESAKKQMRQILGDHVTTTEANNEGNLSFTTIKAEPVMVAQNCNDVLAAGHYNSNYRGNNRGQNYYKSRGRGRGNASNGGRPMNNGSRPAYNGGKPGNLANKTMSGNSFNNGVTIQNNGKKFHKNPIDKDGNHMRCRTCDSTMHFQRECPHKFENVNFSEASEIENKEYILISGEKMEIGKDSKTMTQFTAEAINCAALDTCCTSSVAGKKWLKMYIDSLPENMRKCVTGPKEGIKEFQFGNLGILKSIGQYKIPVIIAGKKDFLTIDEIESDIPLLMSKKDMRSRGMILDLTEDKVVYKGKNVTEDLGTTSAGHYILPLIQKNQEVFNVNEIFAVDLKSCSFEECKRALNKLHKQFGHRPKKCFVDLLKGANVWSKDMDNMLDNIIDNCEGCILRKRNPDKPAVAMPMAKEFNEKVAIDLKVWKGGYILYMIDMFSRLTQAAFITRKTPEQVVNGIMEKWVAHYGVPGAILNDNGGEFVNSELQAVKSELSIIDLTTGAESPWMNGLCEKNHHTMDNILERIDADKPNLSIDTKLAWAAMAKNSLLMVYGYSPFQLVFGKNPNLPNIITDGPPAWEDCTVSDRLRLHLNALHKSRSAFINSESNARIKRALKAKIRCADIQLDPGDIVYYVRDGQNKWLGPAKVIFQDSKIIFLRHGGNVVRVSANRLVKAGEELARKAMEGKEQDTSVKNDALEGERNPPTEMHIKRIRQTQVNNDDTTGIENAEEEIREDISDSEDLVNEEHIRQDEENSKKRKAGKDLTPHKAQKHPRSDIIHRNDRIKVQDSNGNWTEATVLSRAGKASGKFDNCWNIEWEHSEEQEWIDLKDKVYQKIPDTPEEVHAVMIPKCKQKEPKCIQAKEQELLKLKEFKTYEIVKDVGQPRISCTWVLCEKEEGVKARLVARGYEETEDIVSDSPTMSKSSLRVMLALAASNQWTLETTDIKSAFLQGESMSREVYVRPPREAKLEKGYLWKLLKCLYGLKDASKHWYGRVIESLIRYGFEKSKLDPAVFVYKNSNNEIIGFVGVHVDDFIHAGTVLFNDKVIAPLMAEFKVGKNEKQSFMYTGFKITQDETGIMLDQTNYVSKNLEMQELDPSRAREKDSPLTESELTDLRRMVGGINWVVRATRPDLSFELIDLSTKFKNGKVEDLIRARKVIQHLKTTDCKIFFPKLNIASINLLVFTDASFANVNEGQGSVGGQLIFMVDRNQRSASIDWQANKVRRVVRSTLAAETLSLVEGLENALYHRVLISELTGRNADSIHISAIIDNKSCYEAMHSTSLVDDKRLRLEMAELKEMLEKGRVHRVEWEPGSEQLADCLTKKGANGLLLLQVLYEGRLRRKYSF